MASLIPSDRRGTPPSLQSLPGGDAPSPGYYRQIYASLRLPKSEKPTVIGITSAISGEGRTTIALGLAQALAVDLTTPVVLAEADLERPALAPHFGLPPAPGLCEVLREECTLEETMRDVSENLSVITTGMVNGAAPRLLHALSEREPFHTIRPRDTTVVVDLPPIVNHSYSALVAGIVDVVVLVVRAEVTPQGVVQEAITRLGDSAPQGVVLNGMRSSLPRWARRND